MNTTTNINLLRNYILDNLEEFSEWIENHGTIERLYKINTFEKFIIAEFLSKKSDEWHAHIEEFYKGRGQKYGDSIIKKLHEEVTKQI